MNGSRVTRAGLQDARPGRDAPPGTKRPARRRRQGTERADSYYGLPVLNKPVWEAREIAGYFFLGGLAGASSVVALAADLTGRPGLARGAKTGAAVAVSLSMAALVEDLGRPERFLNMLRVFKPTSPMNVGTWLLSAYAPAAVAAAGCSLTGWLPRTGRAATVAAAVIGPAIASYTGVLISDTAVPAWHDGHRVMPFLFTASAATAAAGLGLACAGPGEAGPMTRLAVTGAAGDLIADRMLERELEPVVYQAYRSSTLLKASRILSVAGAAGAAAGSRSRALRIASGLSLMAASACTRFGVFHAGIASAQDPQATVGPQRRSLAARGQAPPRGGSNAALSSLPRP